MLLRFVLCAGGLVLALFIAGTVDVTAQPTETAEPKPLKAPFTKTEAEKARAEWAKHLKVPETKTLNLGGGVTMEVVLIPPGTFQMGSPETEKERKQHERQHEVELTKPFYLAVTETTQAQYRAITGQSPSEARGNALPVEKISWNDSVAYCEKLSKKTGEKVMLPSEAQWEYACRAGTMSVFHFGDVLNGDKANCVGESPYGTESKGPWLKKTTPVTSSGYPANSFGLFDMHGNVMEWCSDVYMEKYETLGKSNPINLGGPDTRRVLRGGNIHTNPSGCRSASRFPYGGGLLTGNSGFRVVVLP